MQVLVVYRNFDHVYEDSVENVMALLYTGKARVLSFSDQTLSVSSRPRYDLDPEIRAAMRGWDTIQIPHAVVLKGAVKFMRPFQQVLSRANLMKRDGRTCQYDDCQSSQDLTIDHVYPEARWKTGEFDHLPFGLKSWENQVIACKPCNNRKGCRTPDEAGMRLKKIPVAPINRIDPAIWDRIYPEKEV